MEASGKRQLFARVDTSYNFPALEEEVLALWERENVFAKSLEKPAPRGNWVFYEGPPTANSLPHPGHVLTRVIKDCLPRFKTMQGYFVRRQAGWDTHGLPVELSVEKELIAEGGMTEAGPDAIRDYGLEQFNKRCFQSVRRYEQEWVRLSNRIGFWLDYEQAYFTFTNKYVESVWWLLKQIYDRGLLYKGHKIQWYSTLVGTGLSSHEVAQNYQTVMDPSVWVRCHVPKGIKIGGHEANNHTYLLLWTTTPWTLLSNVALCVHPEHDYVVVQFHNKAQDRREYLVLAEALLEANGLESELVVERIKGRDLAGIPYDRLFDYDIPNIRRDGVETCGWRVIADTYVTLEEGTGIVHIAPAYGEDDYRVGMREKLPVLNAMDNRGRAIDAVELAPGKWFKDVDPDVITDLKRRGLLFKSQKSEHNYPHCYRTDAPLMSYPLDSWFVKTTAIKDKLVANNKKIRWQPEHIRDGRFGDWLDNVIDWSLSRDRFWGTPLPVWVCEQCENQDCIGSFAELKERCPEQFAEVSDVYDQSQFNPHRPYIDEFSWKCPECGGKMVRERYILDPWFDAGAMPFAQLHYPFEHAELVDGATAEEGEEKLPGCDVSLRTGKKGQFPANFISEAVDQTRGWFYTLHVISTLIKDSPAYESCLVLGHIQDDKGQKMSKRLGNVVDPWQVINNHGADAFRWYFYSSGNLFSGARFSEAGVVEALQRFIIPLWNIYSFFTIYANIDEFDPTAEEVPWERLDDLDKLARIKLNRLVCGVTGALENLALTDAAREIEQLVEFISNWYVRRSRRRFWQSAKDDAKWAAYQTLYHFLTTMSRLLAPFTPFLSEQLYQNLVRPFFSEAPASVHLAEYPGFDPQLTDDGLEYSTDQARRLVWLGHSARKQSGVRVRQPLSRITLITPDAQVQSAIEAHKDVILDELNVKALAWAEDETEFVSYEYKPNFRALGPQFGPAARAVAQWIEGHPQEITAQLEEHKDGLIAAISDPGGEKTHNWIKFSVEASYTKKMDGKKQQVTETIDALVDDSCFDVHLREKPETEAIRDGQLLLVLDTRITPELKLEGLAREVVNRIQSRRKALDLDYTTRIRVRYTAPDELEAAIDAHRGYIMGETLADEFSRVPELIGETGDAQVEDYSFEFSVELG
jgi:isoleucyl-tRNA synthetase